MNYSIFITNTNNPDKNNRSLVADVKAKGDAFIILSALQVAVIGSPLNYFLVCNYDEKNTTIRDNKLDCDMDTPYCEDGNKIDVYTKCSWTADSEEDYIKKEGIISNYKVENHLFKINAWCDVSGYDYWVVKQKEENYVSVDVVLKKLPEEYTQAEIEIIRGAIIYADQYFEDTMHF